MVDSKHSNGKSADSIPCANCLHCKEFFEVSELTGSRERRVRCAAGQWTTRAGRRKTYPLYTVLSRRMATCDRYDSMGDDDLQEFLDTLKATLPVERVIERIRRSA